MSFRLPNSHAAVCLCQRATIVCPDEKSRTCSSSEVSRKSRCRLPPLDSSKSVVLLALFCCRFTTAVCSAVTLVKSTNIWKLKYIYFSSLVTATAPASQIACLSVSLREHRLTDDIVACCPGTLRPSLVLFLSLRWITGGKNERGLNPYL